MIWDCSSIARLASSLPLVEGCDVVRNGALRMSTPFSYPNGDRIDVFLQPHKDLFSNVSLSDFGHTSLYLNNAQIEMGKGERKKEIIASILTQLQVKLVKGDLIVELPNFDGSNMGDAIFRLSQACVRISDFAAHQRLRSANPFRDDIEEFFEAIGVIAIPDQKVISRYKKNVKVDFEVLGKSENSYVCVVSSLDGSAAHTTANEIFRKWYDLAESTNKRLTIYNSASQLGDTDRARLGEFSQVIAYPAEMERLKQVVSI